MNDFETKIVFVDYRDYSEEDWNDIMYKHKFISKKQYENKVREIKIKRLNEKENFIG